MRVVLLLLSLLPVALCPAATLDVPAWIAQLGSPDFAEREAAARALFEAGPSALDALRQATRHPDLEIRRRAEVLVGQIEKRIDSEKLLTPQRVRLNCKNTAISEAIADLARMSGVPLQIDGDPAPLLERRITLDTGLVPIWEALDRLFREAGLVEKPPPPPVNDRRNFSSIVVIGGNQTARDALLRPARPVEPIYLGEGTVKLPPTYISGAVRIVATPGQGKGELTLEATAEPGLRWQKVIGVRVDRAVDEHSQALVQAPSLPFEVPVERFGRRGAVMVNGAFFNPDGSSSSASPRQAPIKLEPGGRPSRSLRELTGVIAAQVQSFTLVAIDHVLDMRGKTFSGAAGSSVKVADVQADEEFLKLKLVVEPPPGSEERPANTGNMRVWVNGRQIAGSEECVTAADFTLLDAAGKPIPALRATNTGLATFRAEQLEITFQTTDYARPTRLVYTGRRTALIEVPFRFKDVPLP